MRRDDILVLAAMLPDQKIVFANYLDAQTRALMWTYYLDKERLMHWYEPPQAVLAAA